jgi:hypothetical protein
MQEFAYHILAFFLHKRPNKNNDFFKKKYCRYQQWKIDFGICLLISSVKYNVSNRIWISMFLSMPENPSETLNARPLR